MKLLCISRKHPPSVGGMQQMNYELIRRLARGTDATVISWGHSQLFLPLFLPCALLRSLCRFPARRRPDAIYLGDALLAPLGLLLRTVLRRPVAVTAHGLDVTFRLPGYRAIIGFCLRRLDLVIGVSGYTTGLCRAIGVPEARGTTINNGVDVTERTPSPADLAHARRWLSAQGVAGDRRIIVTVGRLIKRKGVASFIGNVLPALVALDQKILYLVIGEGKERPAIEEAVTRYGLDRNVLIAGSLPRDLLKGILGISRVCVMPNIPVPGDAEGFGIAALEANCAGLPVVASDIEGLRDAVREGRNGFRVPWDDRRKFGETIAALLNDEAKRNEAGAGAKRFVAAECGWDACARRYLESLDTLAARG
ncbi:MAG: glycosyltransferase family 4 protein [Candidatus Aureabacteria bacterium]|nr:glycosyltransferase family 4 protein [Candidatus Auribacterota bacterium]